MYEHHNMQYEEVKIKEDWERILTAGLYKANIVIQVAIIIPIL